MPAEPEKPRETKKQGSGDEDKEGKEEEGEDDHPMRSIEELKKDPNAVVHCELQDQLSKEFADKGMDFSQKEEDGKNDSSSSQKNEQGGEQEQKTGNVAAAQGGVTEGQAAPAA